MGCFVDVIMGYKLLDDVIGCAPIRTATIRTATVRTIDSSYRVTIRPATIRTTTIRTATLNISPNCKMAFTGIEPGAFWSIP